MAGGATGCSEAEAGCRSRACRGEIPTLGPPRTHRREACTLWPTFAILTLLLGAAAAEAQTHDTVFFSTRISVPAPRYGRRPVPPLAPQQQLRVDRARALRESGRLDAARDTLERVLADVPHHPLALVELARLHEARRAWRAIEALARAERAATRDSGLLAHELVTALERQGRHREAAQAVLEAWVAEPVHFEWARGWLDTLAARDLKGVREVARRTALALPARPDLARVVARLEWRHGDAASAMRLLSALDAPGRGTPLRWAFAEEALASRTGRDSAGAVEAMLDLAADPSYDVPYRVSAGRRAWEVASRQSGPAASAPRVARALKSVPATQWGSTLLVPVMRGLREGGLSEESRALLGSLGEQGRAIPEIALERALGDLRDGPPEKALPALRVLADTLPEAEYYFAEALFFAGQPDSALQWLGRATQDPAGPHTGAALERVFLIEDGKPPGALIAFGRLAYERWRGEPRRALALAESLYGTVARGPLWAQAALELASLREATGDGKAALDPLLAVAEGLPDDRLAPLARQRAGDVLRIWHKDEARALEQYEECLARYPKAWNTPEVRRWVETLRRERRF